MRFGDRLRYDIAIADGAASAPVPRLSLQTLVENSVKYAVSPARERRDPSPFESSSAATSFTCAVEDDGPGFDAAAATDGHGLALLQSRLAMLFGGSGRVQVDSAPGRTWSRLRCRPADEPPAARQESNS